MLEMEWSRKNYLLVVSEQQSVPKSSIQGSQKKFLAKIG